MKSAYELAMERLEKANPGTKLSKHQKEEIAEIDSLYKSKIAEKELFLKDQILKSKANGSYGEVENLEQQLSLEVRKLRQECEEKKDKIRQQS